MLRTLQEEGFLWNLNFAIVVMENLLNFNSAHYYIFRNLSMRAYIIGKFKNQNLLIFNSVNLTDLSQVAKLNSMYIFNL